VAPLPGLGIPQDWPSPGQFIDIQQQSRSFEDLAIARGSNGNLTGRAQPGLRATRVDPLVALRDE